MIYILYYLAKRNEITPLETTNIRATPRHARHACNATCEKTARRIPSLVCNLKQYIRKKLKLKVKISYELPKEGENPALPLLRRRPATRASHMPDSYASHATPTSYITARHASPRLALPLETPNIQATPRHTTPDMPATPRHTTPDMPATLPARRLREEFPTLFAT